MLKSIALWNYGSDQIANAQKFKELGFEAFSFLGRLSAPEMVSMPAGPTLTLAMSRELWLRMIRDYVAHGIFRHALALNSDYRFTSSPR